MLIISDIGKFAFYADGDDVIYAPSQYNPSGGYKVAARTFFMLVQYIHTEE